MPQINNIRNNKKVRLAVVAILLLVVIVLYFKNVNVSNLTTAEGIKNELSANAKPDSIEKKVLAGVGTLLGIGLGMEASNNDIDLGKLIETKSLSGSKVLRDKSGNVVTAEEVKSGAKIAPFLNKNVFCLLYQ